MNICPVCKRELGEAWSCSNCGYDFSLDYLLYPTLSPEGTGRSEAAVRRSWEARKNRVLLCPGCGGIRFHFERESLRFVCADCGRALDSGLVSADASLAPGLRPAHIAAGDWHTVLLRPDGTAAAVGRNDAGQCRLSDWTELVSVAAGRAHTLGLRADGTVLAAGDDSRGQCRVSEWRDVAAIRACGDRSLAIRKDGTILATDWDCSGLEGQNGFVDAALGRWFLLLLREKGELLYYGLNLNAECETLETWRDVIRIRSRGDSAACVRSDGTVQIYGNLNHLLRSLADWSEIRDLALGENHVVGLRKDGTVTVASWSQQPQVVNGWRDVREIAAGAEHTVALTADGRVLTTGDDRWGQCGAAALNG